MCSTHRHLVNSLAYCVLREICSLTGVVGTQQMTVNGDKALQTAVNTLAWYVSGSVRHPSPSRVFVRVGKREIDRQRDRLID